MLDQLLSSANCTEISQQIGFSVEEKVAAFNAALDHLDDDDFYVPSREVDKTLALKEELANSKEFSNKKLLAFHAGIQAKRLQLLEELRYAESHTRPEYQCYDTTLHPPLVLRNSNKPHGPNPVHVQAKIAIVEAKLELSALLMHLKVDYSDFIEKTIIYEDPYNTKGERKRAGASLRIAFANFQETLKRFEEVFRAKVELENKKELIPKSTYSLKYRIWDRWHSKSHTV